MKLNSDSFTFQVRLTAILVLTPAMDIASHPLMSWYSVYQFPQLGRTLQPNNLKSLQTTQFLRRTFTIPNADARKNLYLSLLRSQLTFCSPVWRPSLIKHVELLERVQRRATKFILSNYMLDYKSRLVQLNFFHSCTGMNCF